MQMEELQIQPFTHDSLVRLDQCEIHYLALVPLAQSHYLMFPHSLFYLLD